MAGIQDVVSVAANASADCVITGVAWLMVRLEGARDRGQPLVDTAVAAAVVGLETALATSEALVDRMLPPTEDNKGLWTNAVSVEKARVHKEVFISEKYETVQCFEATLQRSFPERLFALANKLYSRMFHMVRSSSHSWATELALELLYHLWYCDYTRSILAPASVMSVFWSLRTSGSL